MFSKFISWVLGIASGDATLAGALASFDKILVQLLAAKDKLGQEIGQSVETEAALLDAAEAEYDRRELLENSHARAVAVHAKVQALVS